MIDDAAGGFVPKNADMPMALPLGEVKLPPSESDAKKVGLT